MTPLVSPSWLATRLQNHDLIIFDATLPPVGVTPRIDTHARYLAAHIPAAIFFNQFSHTIREIGARMDDFALEFMNMAERSFGE